MKKQWSYFPERGDRCLIGVSGYSMGDGQGSVKETVAFTLCENFPPYRELQDFPPVGVFWAPGERWRLIREYVR